MHVCYPLSMTPHAECLSSHLALSRRDQLESLLHLLPEPLHHALFEPILVPSEMQPQPPLERMFQQQQSPGSQSTRRGDRLQIDAGSVLRMKISSIEVPNQGETAERLTRSVGRDEWEVQRGTRRGEVVVRAVCFRADRARCQKMPGRSAWGGRKEGTTTLKYPRAVNQ